MNNSLPSLRAGARPGVDICLHIARALAEAGMPRLADGTAGDRARGFTPRYVHDYTSQNVRFADTTGQILVFHIILHGEKSGLQYRTYRDGNHTGEEPANPHSLFPRIRAVFESLGFTVHDVRHASWSEERNRVITFFVTTDNPTGETYFITPGR